MGNQLAASVSVNLFDVSPSLELIAPLGGEGRNYFTTVRCYDTVSTSAASLGDIVRDTKPEVPREQQHRRRALQRRARAMSMTSSSSGIGAFFSSRGTTDSTAAAAASTMAVTTAATLQLTGAPASRHANYTQLMLRRDRMGNYTDGTAVGGVGDGGGAGGGGLWAAFPGTRRAGTAATVAASDTPLGSNGLAGSGGAASSPYANLSGSNGGAAHSLAHPQSPWAAAVKQMAETALRAEGNAAATAAASSSTQMLPPSPASPPPTQCKRDTVTKVFVRTADDRGQQWFINRVQSLLASMEEQILVVDATLPRMHYPRHILFYRSMVAQERFCMLQRPFIASSLPERLMMRPSVSWEERLFLCFQLLHAVAQLHDTYGIVHGDIKANNVLLQSTGWLYLTDLAPFKPTRVPANNPALFDYYYDTDETRCCCLAPEKFTDAPLPVQPSDFPAGSRAHINITNINLNGHTPSMDIFSTACVMAYILTDEPLFKLSEVLQLRSLSSMEAREALVRPRLSERGGGLSEGVLHMLLSMLCAMPQERPSARRVLETHTPLVFPRYFALMHDSVLPEVLANPPDVQLQLLASQLGNVLAECDRLTVMHEGQDHEGSATGGVTWDPDCTLNPERTSVSVPGTTSQDSEKSRVKEADRAAETAKTTTKKMQARQQLIRFVLPVLFHSLRAATTDDATYRGVVCLQRWCLPNISLATQLDFIIPHALVLLNSVAEYPCGTRVVALRIVCAIATAASEDLRCMTGTKSHLNEEMADREAEVPAGGGIGDPMDAMWRRVTLFDDLILPCIAETCRLASTEEIGVLVELGSCLPLLLRHARYHLEQRQCLAMARNHTSHYHTASGTSTTTTTTTTVGGGQGTCGESIQLPSYGLQLNELLNTGWDILQLLYKHPAVPVVTAVMRQTLQVAIFLGEARSRDDLIPLLTTAIASAAQVQRELYPSAIAAHLLLQRPQLHTLRLFVEEGLRQAEDITCLKTTLDGITLIVRSRKLGVWDTMTLVHQALPHVLSSSMWVSQAACGVVEAAAQTYRGSEVLTYLECAVAPMLTSSAPLERLGACLSVLRAELAVAATGPQFSTKRTIAPDKTMLIGGCLGQGGSYVVPISNSIRVRDSKAACSIDMNLLEMYDASLCRSTSGTDAGPSSSPSWQAATSVRVKSGTQSPGERERNGDDLREQEDVATVDASTSKGNTWNLTYTPTPREAIRCCKRRLAPQLWQHSDSKDVALQQRSMESPASLSPASGLEEIFTPGVYCSSTSSQQRPLRPIAVPLHSYAAHMGAINACTQTTRDGTFLTAGAMGEALWWRLIGSELRVMARVPAGALEHAYLFAKPVRGGGAGGGSGDGRLLALGGTDNTVSLLDATSNTFVQRLNCFYVSNQNDSDGDGAITDLAVQQEGFVLISTATGHVHAMDIREPGRRPSWTATLDPLDGAPSCLTPLYLSQSQLAGSNSAFTSAAYAFTAATYGGAVALYDLRFGLCVRRYSLDAHYRSARNHVPAYTQTLSRSILTACIDPLFSSSSVSEPSSRSAHERNSSGPALLLGTENGNVYRLHLASGHASLALEPFYGDAASTAPTLCSLSSTTEQRKAPRGIRAMLTQPAFGSIFTAGEDGFIRLWSLRDPKDSHTLCCRPFLSSPYTFTTATHAILSTFSSVSSSNAFGREAFPSLIREQPLKSTIKFGEPPSVATIPRHHKDSILALSVVENAAGIGHLLSASRDGVLTMWFNETTPAV